MSKHSKHTILGVEDDDGVCKSLYRYCLDALSQLQHRVPHLIICDLNMPNMSGFEFLPIVRRRFPGIPAIAASSAYEYCDTVLAGFQADAFYAKGEGRPGKLLNLVADMLAFGTAKRLNPSCSCPSKALAGY